MVDSIGLQRSERLLIKQYGIDAAIVATQCADEMLAKGDVQGRHVRKRIVHEINDLRRTTLKAYARRH